MTPPDALAIPNRIPDEVVLSPEFIGILKELVVVMRPFVHWCVAMPSSQTWLIGLTVHSGSLNDMMTIQDAGEDSSEGEGDDEGTGEDEDA